MKIALILSGCGYLDGAEIRESVLSLLYLDQHGAVVDVFAPDMPQRDVVNHQTGEAEADQSRNVLAESARISRGHVRALDTLSMVDYDGLVIPGGFGVAKNLSNLASAGAEATILPAFLSVLHEAVDLGKPIAAICIAPAVLAVALKGKISPRLTIGDDADTVGLIEACGAVHKPAATSEMVVDAEHRIFSCSAYMREDSIAAVAKGIERTITHFIRAIA